MRGGEMMDVMFVKRGSVRRFLTALSTLFLILSAVIVSYESEGAVTTGTTASLITTAQRVHQNSTAYPSFGISATSSGTDRLTSINVRVYPVNGFTMSDLKGITTDATTSGIALYRDDGAVDDALDPSDTPVNATSTSVVNVGSYHSVTFTYSESVPSSVRGSYHWIVVFRTSSTIASSDMFYLSIPAGGIRFSDSSSQPSSAVNTSTLTCRHILLYPTSTRPIVMGEEGTPTDDKDVLRLGMDCGVSSLEHIKSIRLTITPSTVNLSRVLAPLSQNPSVSGVALYRDNGSSTADTYDPQDDWGIAPTSISYTGGVITLNFSTTSPQTALPAVRSGLYEYFIVVRTPGVLEDAVDYNISIAPGGIVLQGSDGEITTLPSYSTTAEVVTDSAPPSLTGATISVTSSTNYFWAADTDGVGDDDRVYYNTVPGQGDGQFVYIRISGYQEANPDYLEGEPAFNMRPTGPRDERDQTDQTVTYRITRTGTVDNPLTLYIVDKAGHVTYYNITFIEDNTPPRVNSTWARESSPYIYADNVTRHIYFRAEMPRAEPLYVEGRAWEPANESGLWKASFSEEGSLAGSPPDDTTPKNFSGRYLISSSSTDASSPITVYIYDHVRNYVVLVYNYTQVTGRPRITITSPPTGSTVSGTVTVAATVNSSAPLSRVLFSPDGGRSYREMYPRGTEYLYVWDTFSNPEGVSALVVRAEDVVGGVSSTGSWVRVDNYPLSCNITSPTYGKALKGTVSVQVTSTPYATRATLYIGGTLISTSSGDGSGTFSLPFNTRMFSDGVYTLRVVVRGLSNESAESTVTVYVDNTPPALLSKSVVYPPGQSCLKSGDNATFLLRLSDNTSGVEEVLANMISIGGSTKEAFYDDGTHGDGCAGDGLWASGTIKINATWAYHTVSVTVKDRAGNYLNFTWQIPVDNHSPLVERIEVLYPGVQQAAKWGDKIRIRAKVSERSAPVYVTLVLDTSGSMQGEKLTRLKEAARVFINLTRSFDYLAIYIFRNTLDDVGPLLYLPFTQMNSSGKALAIQKVNSLNANSSTPIWDTIGEAALYTIQNSAGASAIVAITDGQDDVLRGFPYEEASDNWCPWHNWTEVRYVYTHLGKYDSSVGSVPRYVWYENPIYEYRRGLLRAPLPIYTIGLGLEHHSPPNYPKAPTKPRNNTVDNVYAYWAGESGTPEYNLWRVATTSAGGEYYYAPDGSQLVTIFRSIAYIIFTQESPGKVVEVKAFSTLLPGSEITLYDDGNHSDGDLGDGLYGSQLVEVTETGSGLKPLVILVKDWAANRNQSGTEVPVDNIPPQILNAEVIYPMGQQFVADGQNISLQVSASDNWTGVLRVTADASSLGYLSSIVLIQEGQNYTVKNLSVITGGIANGHYRVPIEVSDMAGNRVIQALDVRVVNDHAPPEVYVTRPIYGEVIGEILDVEAVIVDESEILWVNATLEGEENITVGYLSDTGGVWKLQVSTRLIEEGAYNLTLRAVDATGRVGVSTPVRVYIDRGTPLLVVTSPHPGEVLSGVVSFDYQVQEENLLQQNLIVDGKTVYPLSLSFDTRLIPDGHHTFTFQVMDIAGRVGRVDVDVVVDNAPPELYPLQPLPGAYLEGEITLALGLEEQAGVDEAGGYIKDPRNLTYIPLRWEVSAGALAVPLDTRMLPDGPYTLHAYVIDLAGNLVAVDVNFSVDNSPPVIDMLFPYPNATLPPIFTPSITVRDTFLESAYCTVGDFTFPLNATVDLSRFPEGRYSFKVWAVDLSGKLSSVSFPVYIDRTPPEVRISSPLKGAKVFGDTVLFQASVRDLSHISLFYFLLDGEINISAIPLGGGVYAVEFPLKYLDHRLHTLQAVAVDGGGLMGVSEEVTFIYQYLDTDGDGVLDPYDDEPTNPLVSGDIDGDGYGTFYDTDDDGDGVPDEEDAFPEDPAEWKDTDGDGVGDNADPDDDGDGVPDRADAFPTDPSEWKDTDGDGIGNNADVDDDGDGVPDEEDAFPEDPAEWKDTDGDGVGDNADTDDDNDGVPDWDDAYPWNPKRSYRWGPQLLLFFAIIIAAILILLGTAFREEVRGGVFRMARRIKGGGRRGPGGEGSEVIILPPPRSTQRVPGRGGEVRRRAPPTAEKRRRAPKRSAKPKERRVEERMARRTPGRGERGGPGRREVVKRPTKKKEMEVEGEFIYIEEEE